MATDLPADAIITRAAPRIIRASPGTTLQADDTNENPFLDGVWEIPANTLRAGSSILIRARGSVTAASGVTLANRIKIGGAGVIAIVTTTVLDDRWTLESRSIVIAPGSPGSILSHGLVGSGAFGTTLATSGNGTPESIDTGVANDIIVTAEFGTATGASDATVLDYLMIDIVE